MPIKVQTPTLTSDVLEEELKRLKIKRLFNEFKEENKHLSEEEYAEKLKEIEKEVYESEI